MINKVTLDNEEFNFNESLLPCLITGAAGSGVSYFSITMVGNLIQQGKKMIFFTAFPVAREELYAQIGRDSTFEIKSELDIGSIPEGKSIVVKSGNIHLWQQVIESIKNIDEYIIFVKNIEEYNETVLRVVGDNKKIIMSGNIDLCSFKKNAVEREWKSKIIFTMPYVNLNIKIPKLEKFESYIESEEYKGILRLIK